MLHSILKEVKQLLYTPLTKKALKLCFDAHKEQTDKSGMPYVFHPFHLAEQMQTETETVCALLHDVIEDTDLTPDDLVKMGFGQDILTVLQLLTHDPSVPYMTYIETLAVHPVARKIKIADLRHNSDRSRLDCIDEKVIAREKKYQKALAYLCDHYDE